MKIYNLFQVNSQSAEILRNIIQKQFNSTGNRDFLQYNVIEKDCQFTGTKYFLITTLKNYTETYGQLMFLLGIEHNKNQK